jgi:hypothetical protein
MSKHEIEPRNFTSYFPKNARLLVFLDEKARNNQRLQPSFIAFVFEKSLQIFVNFFIHSRKVICKESLLSRFPSFIF